MMPAALPDLGPVVPELVMAIGALLLLGIGVFLKEPRASRNIAWASVALMAVTFVLVLGSPRETTLTFADMFVVDGFARFVKLMMLIASAAGVVMSLGFLKAERMERFEYPVLMVLATLGMMMMVSANDLIALYLG